MRVTVAAAMVSWALSVAASAADAQVRRAEPGRFEVQGMDWRPNTAWRNRANLVRSNRWAAIRRGDMRSLNQRRSMLALAPGGGAFSLSVTGTFYVPVIPLAFDDVPAAFSTTQFQEVLFGATPPSGAAYTLKTYYEEVSGGRIQMEGRVFGAAQMDTTAAYYQDDCNGIGILRTCSEGGQRLGRMLLAALDSISNRPGADTVWAQFDNDGPDGAPNSGDDDGVVDFVTFIQPVKDGACQGRGGGGSDGIWAHRYEIAGWNSGSPYVTRTPRAGRPGEFITVNNYTMQSQVGGRDGCTIGAIMPVGTVAHETGHAFGLPDLYDTDQQRTEGVGEWSIMGSGNYSQAYSPSSYDAWSLNELGWITIDTLGAGRTITARARQVSDTVFLGRFAGSPNEFLLIENRQAVHSDTAMFNPTLPEETNTGQPCRQLCPKLPGLLLWHIDLDQVITWRPINRINSGTTRPHGVALVQADGLNNLRVQSSSRNRGDRGDSYPGRTGNTRWSLTSLPAARSNTGLYTGFIIDRIEQLAGGTMRFRYLPRDPTVVVASVAGIRVNVNGRSWSRYEEAIAAGEQFVIDTDSIQTNPDGRTRARFLGWSIGGPRSQTVLSGATPDTIVATFAAEHRLVVVVQGGGQGAVTVGPAGAAAPPGGDFLPAGTPVTVTAAPQAGSLFVGWRGDTVATNPTITLPMGRPYDLEASFVTQVAVAVQAATAEILGTVSLSAEQRNFLDLLGNRNGIYDVGDYLAYLQQTGQPVPPAALHLLGTQRPTRASGRDQ
ncbi:MAG: M6 family metalloprotease domain-containing protein [Gemmatimonadales bacterium]